jgi:hypothetical protein
MRFRRGGRLEFSPGRPEFHVLEPHVTHDHDSPRHTRRACAWHPLRRLAVQKSSICRGNGACSMRMLYITLISISHNHMASHIVKT